MVTLKSIRRPKHLKPELYFLLKSEVEETFGRKLATSGDCIQLCEEIYFKTSYSINSNTIRRFFGLVKADYPPSVSTLNILCKYCGFNSVDELQVIRNKPVDKDVEQVNLNFLNYLVSLFKSIQVKDEHDETFIGLVKQTVVFLRENPELADKFQRAIVKTKNGFEYYFEQFVHIDKLNAFYGDGLRYYLNEKKTPETQVFGYSLLCMRDWFNADNSLMKKNFDNIKVQSLPRQGYSHLQGRLYASQLLYADAFELDTDKILNEAYKQHAKVKPAQNRVHNSFEYNLGFALTLTKHFEEALYYIEYVLQHHSKQHSVTDQGSFKKLLLLKAIALCKTGEVLKADKLFSQLRPSQFYFLSKDVDTILYLALAQSLNKSNAKMNAQFDELIERTGYIKLQSLIA